MSSKKTHVSIGIGTVSLLLALSMLSMSLLVVLSVLSVHNDAKLTERSIAIAKDDGGLYALSEELRASLMDAANAQIEAEETPAQLLERLTLPEGAATDEDSFAFTLTEGNRMLNCVLRAGKENGMWHFTYTQRKLSPETEEE